MALRCSSTHVDVLQVQEVQHHAVPLPDDGRAQRPLDGAGEDGAEAHRYRGDADRLVLRQAQLDHLCEGERERERERMEANKRRWEE